MYEYFVSYSYINGFGHCAVERDGLIDSGAEAKALNDFLVKEYPECPRLVVMNFILLSGPKS